MLNEKKGDGLTVSNLGYYQNALSMVDRQGILYTVLLQLFLPSPSYFKIG